MWGGEVSVTSEGYRLECEARWERKTMKLTAELKGIIEAAMRNDETTGVQLHALLVSKGYNLSLTTILRCRKALGWTFRGSANCQMIHKANEVKRLQWTRQYIYEAKTGFLNVIFKDETSVQLESHGRFCCRKRGEPPRNKTRYWSFCLICLLATDWV